jgi:hypothetical protein
MEEIIGQKFGRLTVIGITTHHNYMKRVTVICDCGAEKIVFVRNLKTGATRSCGCLQLEKRNPFATFHGLRKHPLYNVWSGLKDRCKNPNLYSYKDYGGRGITACEEWKNSFQSFYDWAIKNGWEKNLEINRINNDGNYEPSNCNFVTPKENSRNRRNNVIIEYNGQSKVLAEWADIYQIELRTLWARIFQYNWDLQKAFNTPINEFRNRNILTKEQVLEIYLSSDSTIELSQKYSVSQPTISAIKTGRNWKHLTSTLKK